MPKTHHASPIQALLSHGGTMPRHGQDMDAIIACTGDNRALGGIQSLFNVVEYIDTDVEYIDDDVEYVDTVVK